MENKREPMESFMRLSRNLRRQPKEGHGCGHGQRPHGSHGHMRLLRVIQETDGLNSRELAEILDIRPSSLTELLNRLESDGALLRQKDEKDARVVRISITEKGREIYEQRREERRRRADPVFACLSPEEKELFCALCDKISDHIEEQKGTEPGC